MFNLQPKLFLYTKNDSNLKKISCVVKEFCKERLQKIENSIGGDASLKKFVKENFEIIIKEITKQDNKFQDKIEKLFNNCEIVKVSATKLFFYSNIRSVKDSLVSFLVFDLKTI